MNANTYLLMLIASIPMVTAGCLQKSSSSSDKSAEIALDMKTKTASLKVAIKDALKRDVKITKVAISGTPSGYPDLAGFEIYLTGKTPSGPDCSPSNPCVANNELGGKGSTTDPGSKGSTVDPGSKGSTTDPGTKGNSVATNDVGSKGIVLASNDPCGKGGCIELVKGETFFEIKNINPKDLPPSVYNKLLQNATALEGTDPGDPIDLNAEIVDAKVTSLGLEDAATPKEVIPAKGQLAPVAK